MCAGQPQSKLIPSVNRKYELSKCPGLIIDFIIQIKSRNIEIEDLKKSISAACLVNEKRK